VGDRDAGGARRSERHCRLGDDPPLCAFEPLTHIGWVVFYEKALIVKAALAADL